MYSGKLNLCEVFNLADWWVWRKFKPPKIALLHYMRMQSVSVVAKFKTRQYYFQRMDCKIFPLHGVFTRSFVVYPYAPYLTIERFFSAREAIPWESERKEGAWSTTNKYVPNQSQTSKIAALKGVTKTLNFGVWTVSRVERRSRADSISERERAGERFKYIAPLDMLELPHNLALKNHLPDRVPHWRPKWAAGLPRRWVGQCGRLFRWRWSQPEWPRWDPSHHYWSGHRLASSLEHEGNHSNLEGKKKNLLHIHKNCRRGGIQIASWTDCKLLLTLETMLMQNTYTHIHVHACM